MVKDDEFKKDDLEFEGGDDKSKSFDFGTLFAESLKEIKDGQIVKGKIIEIREKDVVIDIGYKSEGSIPLYEFSDPKSLKVGDEVEVLVEARENDDGNIVLSKQKAERSQGWEKIVATYHEGDIIKGRVTRKIKGGLMVDIGVESFLPASLATLKGFANLNQLLGQTLDFKIVKINKPRKNIVVSRKDLLQQQMEESRAKLLTELEKGKVIPGVIKNITDFGAFIDLGGVDGLLHITDMSWGRISHPSEILAIGDKIEVVVLDIDKTTFKVSLGLKQKTANPWVDIEGRYPIGSKVKGKVVNLMPYGAFVELEKGVEALIHISELSWTKRYANPNELLAIGDVVEAIVLDMDKNSQKISLGIKQLEADPWSSVEEKYPSGMKIKGKVRNLTDFGAFIEIEEGIDGFLHISDMSWTKKINHPREVLKKGQRVDALILAIDPKNRKIALGVKQLMPDPWNEIAKRYSAGATFEGQITKVTNFGVFVELEKDLEGLIHISELGGIAQEEMEKNYKVGDKIKVAVIKTDVKEKKIALKPSN